MESRRSLSVLVALLALAAVLAGGIARASKTYTPPLPPRLNKALLVGERLWGSERIVGPGGQTCAACHDGGSGPALDREALLRKAGDLSKLVYFELVSRSNNRLALPDGPEVEALVAYLEGRFDLGRQRVDDPRAEAALEDGRRGFLEGDYAGAIARLEEALELARRDELRAEAHILLGSVRHALGDEAGAISHFTVVLRLFPDVEIDREVFSPKTVELFERVRQTAVPANPSP